jgi:hypothetical protein
MEGKRDVTLLPNQGLIMAMCRYMGSDPEPRQGLSSGHIPHSFSLPFNAFLHTNTIPHSSKTFTTFLPPNELHRKLADAVGTEYAQLIIDGKRSVATTCGSGMTAGILWLGLKLIEESTSVAIFDEVHYTQRLIDKLLMPTRSLGQVMRRARRARLIRAYHSCLFVGDSNNVTDI